MGVLCLNEACIESLDQLEIPGNHSSQFETKYIIQKEEMLFEDWSLKESCSSFL